MLWNVKSHVSQMVDMEMIAFLALVKKNKLLKVFNVYMVLE